MMRNITTAIVIFAVAQPAFCQTEKSLADQARNVLDKYCAGCHANGKRSGGFGDVLDLKQLVADQRVVPGQPEQSELLQKIVDGDMPPRKVTLRPNAKDIDNLRKWIAAGAPSGESGVPSKESAPRGSFISPTDIQNIIQADLENAKPGDRRFFRYLTLTHSYNAGRSLDELQTYRDAVSLLINSLSERNEIHVPKAIDTAGTILRIDLRDYSWTERMWDAVAARDSFAFGVNTSAARKNVEATRSQSPNMRADVFVALASVPPLYYQLLRIPTTRKRLEQILNVDSESEFGVVRAGFRDSQPSRNNRIVQVSKGRGGRLVWWSDDFSNNLGRQNIFAFPVEFKRAGGEVIYRLPNGLQAYALYDSDNKRIDKAPTAIVTDPGQSDGAVHAAVSCMRCHRQGILKKKDQIRNHVEQNARAFSVSIVQRVKLLYPPAAHMDQIYDEERKTFVEAAVKTGAKTNGRGELIGSDPISTVATLFEADVDLDQAAAEFGTTPKILIQELLSRERFARFLGSLKVPGGKIKREVLIGAFKEVFGNSAAPAQAKVPQKGKVPPRKDLQLGDVDISLQPTFGSKRLKAGFVPDPFTKPVVAGGPIKTRLGGVSASVARAPDFTLVYEAGSFPLTIRADSRADTTLLVVMPDGTVVADDDSGGNLNPRLHFARPQAGTYQIYVGTFGPELAPATLIITELEGR
jgi:mono/diheme cytochrome c family protein